MADHSDGRGYSNGAQYSRRASTRATAGSSGSSRRASYSETGRRSPREWVRGEEPLSYGRNGTYAVKPARPRSLALIVALTVFACIVVIFAIVNLLNAGAGNTNAKVHEAAEKLETAGTVGQAVTDLAPERDFSKESSSSSESNPAPESDLTFNFGNTAAAQYLVEPADMLAIPGSNTVITLDLANGSSASADDNPALNDVRSAVAEIEGFGNCGFVFVDMNTGQGLAYNADEVVYVASAAKAPFIYWLLSSGVGYEEYDWDNIAWTIEDSENEAFETLFFEHYNEDYAAMMAKYDVQHDDYYNDFYPKMNARSLASLWVDMLRYMQGGSEDANWFLNLLGNTTMSFIRDGLYDEGVVVVNKAGWINEEGYLSVTDAGLIQSGSDLYLMVIVTDQSDADVTEQNLSALARALYDARDAMRGQS